MYIAIKSIIIFPQRVIFTQKESLLQFFKILQKFCHIKFINLIINLIFMQLIIKTKLRLIVEVKK